jgi:two-component system, NarL family, response regulator LiaR
MENSALKRLLIADDHDLVRRGLRGLLRREPDLEIVGEARDGREAVELGLSLVPDLILMDVRMPGRDGLEATREIKAERPEIGILMVTMHDDPDYMLEAIKSGAAGYVLKDASWEDLTTSVRRALSGDFPMDPDVAARLLQRLARETPQQPGAAQTGAGPAGRLSDTLTPRELEVLQRLTYGRTNSGIAQDLTISVGTAKTHVQRVIQKLGVSDRTQAAVRAVELRLVKTTS